MNRWEKHPGKPYAVKVMDDPLDILQRFRDPGMRYGDIPGADLLAQARMLAVHDSYLADLHAHLEHDQMAKAVISGDPYYGNPPPSGTLPPLEQGRIPIARLLTDDVLSIPIEHLVRNMLLCGPTGSGKTNYLRILLAAVMKSPSGLVVAFDRKGGELVNCATLTTPGIPIWVLLFNELMLAALQKPDQVALDSFVNTFVQLTATQLNLFASRRLLGETLALQYKRERPQGRWPRLSDWIATIDNIHVNALSRLGQYREAALWSLKSIYRELWQVIDYAASNMLDELFKLRGCVVISTSGLSVEAESFLISLIINHAYLSRQNQDPDSIEPLIFVLDDSLPLVRGDTAREVEGGINPISNWAFMGRSRKISLVCAIQNFALISPALSNNSDTVLCFGSYGQDAHSLARYMNLTPEQAAVLPVIRPGEVIAIARSTWPVAIRGSVPEVP